MFPATKETKQPQHVFTATSKVRDQVARAERQAGLPGVPLQVLQRSLGNSYLQASSQLPSATLQRACACGAGASCAECAGQQAWPMLQTKLTVGSANDIYEQEADQVAEHIVGVVAGSENAAETLREESPRASTTPEARRFVQRQANTAENAAAATAEVIDVPPEISTWLFSPESATPGGTAEVQRDFPQVQFAQDSGGALQTPGSDLETTVSQAITGGSAFTHPVKTAMEGSFHANLSAVQIHTGEPADRACRALQARAFTLGSHIAFAQGEYQPDSRAGHHLLAHELTHVLQQRDGTKPLRRQVSCPPAGAAPYTPTASTHFNCYAYVLDNPIAGMLTPGELATGRKYGGMDLWSTATYTRANVQRLTEQDLGTASSENTCCSGTTRLIAEVVTDDATSVATATGPGGVLVPVPRVGSRFFDFHWYRQDADALYSHKPGRNPSSRSDAAGQPISHPYAASRSYSYANYNNYVGTWCTV